jgi:hypothetical protein
MTPRARTNLALAVLLVAWLLVVARMVAVPLFGGAS